MQAHFLLGPAGSGKTCRCLAEIRAALLRSPDGPPLVLLAPKQATFQLERQLLANPKLPGYTRLQILSFNRLAENVLSEISPAAPRWLDDEGRSMVIRALLARNRTDLKLFHATARLPGFATRLSLLLRDLQQHQISPQQLLTYAEKISSPHQLRDKLHDFALILDAYLEWLRLHDLRDADCILDEAATALRSNSALPAAAAAFPIGGIWMDGFAELTAQELDLLAAVVPLAERTTLAFCLPKEIGEEPSWLSPWAVIGQTYLRCRERIGKLPGVEVSTEMLPAQNQPTRFSSRVQLARLESAWSKPALALPEAEASDPRTALRLFSCSDPEAEATLAAREIRRFVREGGRYREAAVLVRSLDSYADTLRRIFARYAIPVFLDRRESVSHHPLAELTRYALRTVAFGWRHADWFGALKTGLVPVAEGEIDSLENAALEFGWQGEFWQKPASGSDRTALSESTEQLRQQIVPPFIALASQTATPFSGESLARALRELWSALDVETTLTKWNAAANQAAVRHPQSPIHATVFAQMETWLDNLARAFPSEPLPLREWLPILESGLANLTIGVIPPMLDQVLIGAVDRSRNPDLKLACVLGLNEGVFPAPPQEDPLLNESERDTLQLHGAKLGATNRHRLGHEWFYGYIACTRASERLVLTCAKTDTRGNRLNRSPFCDHVQRLLPALEVEDWQPPPAFEDVEHVNEIIAPALRWQEMRPAVATPNLTADELAANPALIPILAKARELAAAAHDQLRPATAGELYGRELATSVSALENFAACPFKFFVSHGLRAAERKEYELDPRERGSFQHEVLTRFHNELRHENLRWRDLTADEARARVRRIGENLLSNYRQGLLVSDAARRFTGGTLLDSLETLISVLIGWARDYQFDPMLVEVGFGLKEDSLWPAWRLELDDQHALLLRGRIDRVDVWRDRVTGAALAVVLDYKSSSRKPDELKLYHGLQLQLPAYLAALEQLPEARATLEVTSLTPAGIFYVNLRGEFVSEKNRTDALADSAATIRQGFQHAGRFDATFYNKLDPRGTKEQFKTHHASRNQLDPAAFRGLLTRAMDNLRRFGKEIYSGAIAPAPFRKGSETACNFCEYAAICRFDPWTQAFRALKPPAKDSP